MSAGKRGSRQASEVPRLVPKAHGDVATQDENQKRALGIDKHAADRQSWTLVDLGFKTSGHVDAVYCANGVRSVSHHRKHELCLDELSCVLGAHIFPLVTSRSISSLHSAL